MDSLGNREGMNVSFWVVESLSVGGRSYTSGAEAARYNSASGKLQVRAGFVCLARARAPPCVSRSCVLLRGRVVPQRRCACLSGLLFYA